jgi:outer membrane lipoprotein-sorting protein
MNIGWYLTFGMIFVLYGIIAFVFGVMCVKESEISNLQDLQNQVENLSNDLIKAQRRGNEMERRLNEEISGRIDFLIDINRALDQAEANRKG